MADSPTSQAPVATATTDVGKLVQQLKQQQRELWQQGQHEQAEALLEKHPQLAHAPEAFSLVYGEFLLNEEFGVTPHLGRFKERFPHFAERLDDQVKLHNIFSNTAWRHSTDPADHQLIADLSPIPDIPGFDQFTLLGRGGMGLVYKARQVKLDRWVAIKMMIGGIYAGQESLARFRTEAEAVAISIIPTLCRSTKWANGVACSTSPCDSSTVAPWPSTFLATRKIDRLLPD